MNNGSDEYEHSTKEKLNQNTLLVKKEEQSLPSSLSNGSASHSCSSCHEVKQVKTKFKWLDDILNFINKYTNLWILLFSNIILLTLLNYIVKDNSFLDALYDKKSIPMAVIATLAMLLLYPKFVVGFFHDWKRKSFGMMTIIALSATIGYFLSLSLFLDISINDTDYGSSFNNNFFDFVIAILVFLSIGMVVEGKITKQGNYDIHQMLKIKDQKVISADGKVINLKKLKVGDLIYINQQADILVDAEIIKGQTYVTESFLTGEENPIFKKPGMLISAGSINIGGRILVKVINTLEQSNIARIINQSKNIAKSKPRIQKIADRIAHYLVFVEIIGALLAFGYKFGIEGLDPVHSVIWSISIFVIICPCALGILTPAILMTASSIMNKRNILIKNSDVFNNAKSIKYVVFDKTGTVVSNKLEITKWKGNNEALAIIKGMEIISEHPIAKAIFSFKKEVNAYDQIKVTEILGVGLKATYQDDNYYLGGKKLIEQLQVDYQLGTGEIILIKNKKYLASFFYQSKINPRLKELVQKFRGEGIKTVLLSGDNEKNVALIAKEVGFDTYYADKLPEEKEKIVSEYKQKGKVMYVGDGINDVIALANADISVAVSTEYNSFNIPSNVIVFNEDVANVYPMLNIMKITQTYVFWGIIWAIIYNIVFFFLVIFVNIHPTIGALVMLGSDFFILFIILTFRLMRLDRKNYFK